MKSYFSNASGLNLISDQIFGRKLYLMRHESFWVARSLTFAILNLQRQLILIPTPFELKKRRQVGNVNQ